jgi:DDE superfamily endonuclease
LATYQKKAFRRGAEIVFVDETGFSFRAKTGTTWAPRGQTPILRRVSKRRELSTVIGLALSGKIYKRHFEHPIGATDILVALQHFKRHISGPMIIIWDRLNAHRAVIVQDYVAAHPDLEVAWLPPYAPDLNPEEGCHGNVKQHLRNATPVNTHDIRTQVDCGFARLRQRPDLLLGFFHHAGLHVNQLW